MRLRVLVLILVVAAMVSIMPAVAAADGPTLAPIEQLGKSIFFDENLSLNSNQSCATCHAPESGWTGPDSAINMHGGVYEGSIPGAFGDRKPPSSAYATFAPIFHMDKKGNFVGGNFWDGRATGEHLGNPSADQALGPFLNPKEQALPSGEDVVAIIGASSYSLLFEQVWGPAIWLDPPAAFDAVGLSVAAYEASAEVNAFTSKFDAWKAGMTSLTQEEVKGFALFVGKGKCGKCHTANGKAGTPALFTDYTYDNLGLPKNPENPATIADPTWADPGLGGYLEHRAEYAPYAAANMGKFKVPTLRNVAKGTPGIVKCYGHNGYFKSLEEIVHFYNTRDDGTWPAPEVAANMNTTELGNLGLSAAEELQIVAFLKTLDDGWMAP